MGKVRHEVVVYPVRTVMSPFITIHKLSRDYREPDSESAISWCSPIYYGIDYVTKGKGIFRDRRHTGVDYGEGAIIILRPDHEFSCECAEEQTLEHLWIRFSGSLVDALFDSVDIPTIHPAPSPIVVAKFLNVMKRCQESQNDCGIMLKAATELVSVLGDLSGERGADEERESYIERYIRFASDHVEKQELPLERFLRKEGVGFEMFRKKMKKATGFYPHDFWLKCKLDRAKNLIETTRLSIGEIACESGFHDVYYFSAYFKRKTGVSPTQYRNLNIENHLI